MLISNFTYRPVVVLLPRSFSSCWFLEREIASNFPRVVPTRISKSGPKTSCFNEARVQRKRKTTVPPVLRRSCLAFREVPSNSNIFQGPIDTQFMDTLRAVTHSASQFIWLLSPYLSFDHFINNSDTPCPPHTSGTVVTHVLVFP